MPSPRRMVLAYNGEQRSARQGNEELWVLVEAGGSTWWSQIWQLESAERLEILSEVAWELASRLEDGSASRSTGAEQPIARFVIPSGRS